MTGGIVAKSVGGIGTIVVAVPPTSPPHAEMPMTSRGAAAMPSAIVVIRGPNFIAPTAYVTGNGSGCYFVGNSEAALTQRISTLRSSHVPIVREIAP